MHNDVTSYDVCVTANDVLLRKIADADTYTLCRGYAVLLRLLSMTFNGEVFASQK